MPVAQYSNKKVTSLEQNVIYFAKEYAAVGEKNEPYLARPLGTTFPVVAIPFKAVGWYDLFSVFMFSALFSCSLS